MRPPDVAISLTQTHEPEPNAAVKTTLQPRYGGAGADLLAWSRHRTPATARTAQHSIVTTLYRQRDDQRPERASQ